MSPRLILSLLALTAIAWFVWSDLEATSPGQLSQAHLDHPDLDGQQGCVQCHRDGGFVDACASCHAETTQSIQTKSGLHGTLMAAVTASAEGSKGEIKSGAQSVPAESCNVCHREHHGRDLRLVSDTSWALAGVADPATFDHARLGFEMQGAHTQLECTACHANAQATHLERGQQRFTGLEQSCTPCHNDPHNGQIQRDCAECHGQARPFTELDGYVHSARFALTGPHSMDLLPTRLSADDFLATTQLSAPKLAALLGGSYGQAVNKTGSLTVAGTCTICHAPGSEHSVEALADHPPTTERSCVDCHNDPHESKFGSDCTACHSAQGPWDNLQGFEHKMFALTGVHAASSCTGCHAETSAHSVDQLTANVNARLVNEVRACATCHDDPHTPAFTLENAKLSNVPADASCATCHGNDEQLGAAPGVFGFRIPQDRVADWLPADFHNATSMPLVEPHADAGCASCHAGAATQVVFTFEAAAWRVEPAAAASFAERFHTEGARQPDDCTACHNDPHAGEFAASAIGGGMDCMACHTPTRFAPSTFDLAKHQTTNFPLEGAHQAVTCRKCHTEIVPSGPAAGLMTMLGTATECAACHANIHAEATLSNLSQLVLPLPEASDAAALDAGQLSAALGNPAPSCAQCHTTETFNTLSASAAAQFDHSTWCGFALDGQHGALDCTVCHAASLERPLGPVVARFPAQNPAQIDACNACHKDVHAGAFDGPKHPALVEGRADCARCHTTAGFQLDPADTVFDHALWTGYALDGAHMDVTCAACHTAPRGASSAGLTLGRAPGTDCASCHSDIHLGQFELTQGTTDCTRCHTTQAEPRFAAVGFDHARDAKFALDETHAPLDCAACHKAYPLSGGGSVVRYKPLGTSCADCHGVVPK